MFNATGRQHAIRRKPTWRRVCIGSTPRSAVFSRTAERNVGKEAGVRFENFAHHENCCGSVIFIVASNRSRKVWSPLPPWDPPLPGAFFIPSQLIFCVRLSTVLTLEPEDRTTTELESVLPHPGWDSHDLSLSDTHTAFQTGLLTFLTHPTFQ